MIRSLTDEEALAAAERGGFDETAFTGNCALILTQSWCPQWAAMRSYLEEAEKRSGGSLTILYFEYDKAPFYEKFMNFKEDTYKNREIPYVRYYSEGKCTGQSNYVNIDGFLHRLGKK